MKSVKLSFAVAVVLAALPLVSFAQEAVEVVEVEEVESPISWSVAATSDYVFRGVSQTDEGPALQASITYTAPVGFYAGVWASNVDFPSTRTNVEVDTFIGYNTDLGGDDFVNLDIMLNRYNYLGGDSPSDLGYNELITKLTFNSILSVTAGYTNDVWGTSTDGWYFGAGASFPLPKDFSLNFNAGQSLFDDSAVARDYVDYGVSLSKSWGSFTASLAYVGTNRDGTSNFGETADDRGVLTLTYSP